MPVCAPLRHPASWMLALVVLSGCAASSPALIPASASGQPTVTAAPASRSASLVRDQADPPLPLLEHPGKPQASGQVWLPGRWDRVGSQFRWQAGQWSVPKLGYLWQPHDWRRDAKSGRWVQDGGQWIPDPNKPPGWYKPRR